MKIFLREKDLVSTQTLMILNFETEASASEIRLDHEIMSNKLHFYSMIFIANTIFFLLTSIMITPWLFIPWIICFVVNFVIVNCAKNHRRQANSWFIYAMWKYQEELDTQTLAEHVAQYNYFDDDYFDKPSWLYSKPAETKSQFEIET